MSDRQRQRKGTSSSIAGDAADEVVATLVDQFSDPYAFIRELIQNSIDAGASRLAVQMGFADGVLEIALEDDGEGMDLATIEGYLLVKFRSTKDRDLTKIGKFGIGFVSVFAMKPFEVVVDTGRDAVWHRVVFDETLRYRLLRLPDPLEGTTVRLRIRTKSATEAGKVCQRVHDSAVRWCRFAEAEVTTTATGIPSGWADRPIRRPFGVEAPIVVREDADSLDEGGFVAIVGPHRGDRPPIGFYNQGLTLWEAEEPMIPGVTFKVAARQLEHTLTRDNVIRDSHFEAVLDRVRALARGPLGDAVHEALRTAARDDPPAVARLFAAFGPTVPWAWRSDVPLFPKVGGGAISLGELAPGLFGRIRGPEPVWCAPAGSPLAQRVAATGATVLVGAVDDPHLVFARTAGRPIVAVETAWRCPLPYDAEPADTALLDAVRRLVPRELHLGRAGGTLVVSQRVAFAAEKVETVGTVGVVSAEHPLYLKLRRLPPAVGAPLLARAIVLATGGGPLDPALVVRVLDALEPR